MKYFKKANLLLGGIIIGITVCLTAHPLFAQNSLDNWITIQVDSAESEPGSIDTLSIWIENQASIPISSIEMVIDGFQERLGFSYIITDGTLISEDWTYRTNSEEGGKLKVAAGGSRDITDNGILLKMELQVPEDAFEEFVNVNIVSLYLNEIEFEGAITNGGINVVNGLEPPLYGDVNGDSLINSVDAAWILDHMAGIRELNPAESSRADVTWNNSISAMDAAAVLMYEAGVIDDLPVTGDILQVEPAGYIDIPDEVLSPGDTLLLPVPLFEPEGIYAISGTLQYDSEMLQLLADSANMGSDRFLVHTNRNDTLMNFAIAGATPIGVQNTPLMVLPFINMEGFEDGTASVQLNQLQINEGPVIQQADVASISIHSTAVEEYNNGLPKAFVLAYNYPNPFNPSTQIKFGLPEPSEVSLEVFNSMGQRVALLVNNRPMSAGWQTMTFNAAGLSSGVYMARLSNGEVVHTQKMLYIK